MKRVTAFDCDDCHRAMSPTERRWEHHTNGGLRVERFCEACMLDQVNGYAERTIAGMFNGDVQAVINGEPVVVVGAKVRGRPASEAERSEP